MTATETMNPTVDRLRFALNAAVDLVERIDPPEWVAVSVEYRPWNDQPSAKIHLHPRTWADVHHITSRMPGAVWDQVEHLGTVWDACQYFGVTVHIFQPARDAEYDQWPSRFLTGWEWCPTCRRHTPARTA